MRTSARMAGAVAAAAAIALLVSGCGSSDSDKGDSDGKHSAQPSGPAEPEKSEAPADGPGTLPGIWKAETDGKPYVLTIAGDAVTLLREKTNCTGRVLETGGSGQSLALKCPGGGGEDRTNGTVGSLKAKSMKVTWNGGVTDNYAKVAEAPAKLPKDPKDMEKLVPTN